MIKKWIANFLDRHYPILPKIPTFTLIKKDGMFYIAPLSTFK